MRLTLVALTIVLIALLTRFAPAQGTVELRVPGRDDTYWSSPRLQIGIELFNQRAVLNMRIAGQAPAFDAPPGSAARTAPCGN